MTHAIDSSVAFLRAQVRHATQLGRSRLETHVALARAAGVSAGTMLAAVRKLVNEGVLVSRRKSGLHVASQVPQATAPSPAATHHGVAGRIREQILTESITAASVLTPKEVSRQFGVCYRTSRRALELLADEGIATKHGRSYRLTELHTRPGKTELILVGASNRFGRLEEFSGRVQSILRVAERACVARSMPLAVVGFDFRVQRFVFPRAKRAGWPQALVHAAGCLVLPHAITRERLRELLDACADRRIPVAIVDDAGGFDSDAVHRGSIHCRLFSLVLDTRAGMHAGAMLRRYGHRAAAYFSPFHNTSWSRQRLEGLEESLGRGSVEQFTIDGLENLTMFVISESAARRALAALPPIKRFMDMSAPLSAECVEEVRSTLFNVAHNEIVRARMWPLFEQALRRREVTAWVACNDEVVLTALDFLHERRLDVPSKLSVIGFDNSTAALARRLTSYSFSEARAVDMVMRYLLVDARRAAVRAGEVSQVTVDGSVVERDTVARARTV